MDIGKNITNLRKEHNLTQEELANIINVSPKTISSYENNRSLPNIEILILLAKVFNTNINDILGLTKNNTEEINKAYEKKKFKDTIINFVLMFSVLIVPIIFFWYAGYISIAAFAARLFTEPNIDISNAARLTLNIYNNLTIEYIIYLLIMLINFILYKKKFKKTLYIISSIITIIALAEIIYSRFLNIDLFIFIFAGIFGFISALKIIPRKKTSP